MNTQPFMAGAGVAGGASLLLGWVRPPAPLPPAATDADDAPAWEVDFPSPADTRAVRQAMGSGDWGAFFRSLTRSQPAFPWFESSAAAPF